MLFLLGFISTKYCPLLPKITQQQKHDTENKKIFLKSLGSMTVLSYAKFAEIRTQKQRSRSRKPLPRILDFFGYVTVPDREFMCQKFEKNKRDFVSILSYLQKRT